MPNFLCISSNTFCSLEFINKSTPIDSAISLLFSCISMAIIGYAPAILATLTKFIPSPPKPITKKLSPILRSVSLSMIPSAVERPHPSNAQKSVFVSKGTAVILFSETIEY